MNEDTILEVTPPTQQFQMTLAGSLSNHPSSPAFKPGPLNYKQNKTVALNY